MIIHNVRLGHACNSSSSHSLIFIPRAEQGKIGRVNDEDSEFGWGTFTLTAPKNKAQYLALQVYNSLQHSVGEQIATHVVHSLFGDQVQYADSYEGNNYRGPAGSPSGYIDHQSVWSLPQDFHGRTSMAFIEDLKEWIMQEDLVILGGNDNGGDHPLEDKFGGHFTLDADGSFVARKDPEFGFWTLFNRYNGNKMRVSFGIRQQLQAIVEKASIPELVDLKITDYCPIGCAFCYQDSTAEGVHGDYQQISNIISSLARMEVFELAIGGGEPTMHPRFVEILKDAKRQGINPNFTTKSLAWLKNAGKAREILDTVGAFAFSVTSADEVEKVIAAVGLLADRDNSNKNLPHTNVYTKKTSVQYVLGTTDMDEFRKIAEVCAANHIRLTILGYKQVGRGPAFDVIPHENWFSVLKTVYSNRWDPVGIDTAVVKQFESELVAAGIPPEWYHKDEGKFSCYIDAVAVTMAPSSYEGEPVKLYDGDKPDRWVSYDQKIQNIFARF